LFFINSKAAEGRRSPRRWREYYGSRVRGASWSAPVLWRFPHGADSPAKCPHPSRWQFSDDFSNLSSPPGKAAEGRRTPRRWREGHGSRVREASWSAPVPWRFAWRAQMGLRMAEIIKIVKYIKHLEKTFATELLDGLE